MEANVRLTAGQTLYEAVELSSLEISSPEVPSEARATISAYFATLNANQFSATAQLFAVDGQLLPPFESAIVGREAILAYLNAETNSLKAYPQTLKTEVLSTQETRLQVIGQVQTALFTINVSWQFVVTPAAEIVSLKIKLLAPLKDLLHLKR
jgi:ketosteroid isomerase-like protein